VIDVLTGLAPRRLIIALAEFMWLHAQLRGISEQAYFNWCNNTPLLHNIHNYINSTRNVKIDCRGNFHLQSTCMYQYIWKET
jgi:hypothetical protein